MTTTPANWRFVALNEIAEVRLGRQRSPRNHTGEKMRPYLRAANITWEGLSLADVKSMNFTDKEMRTYRLQPGDLLLNEASGSPGEVGKPALWTGEIDDCAFQNTLIRIRPDETVEPKYLLHFFRWQALAGRFVAHSRGVGIHHLGRTRLSSWSIPVPPLGEQRHIVAVLESQLSRIIAASDYLFLGSSRGRTLVSTVLQSLIPDVREYPSHWTATTVGEAGQVDLGRQRHPDWHTGSNMRRYLRVANVFEDRIDDSDVHEMHWPDETFDRYRLLPGDILLNEGQTPALLGRPALYRGIPTEVAFTKSLIRFRARRGVNPEFALLVFRRHMHAGRFRRESRITTNIAHLPVIRLKPIEFPIPPEVEQSEIVAQARDRFDSIQVLKSEIANATRRSSALRLSLLSAAFTGQLTSGYERSQIGKRVLGA